MSFFVAARPAPSASVMISCSSSSRSARASFVASEGTANLLRGAAASRESDRKGECRRETCAILGEFLEFHGFNLSFESARIKRVRARFDFVDSFVEILVRDDFRIATPYLSNAAAVLSERPARRKRALSQTYVHSARRRAGQALVPTARSPRTARSPPPSRRLDSAGILNGSRYRPDRPRRPCPPWPRSRTG